MEGYLVAVISLPAGVFKPYSVAKTSILILDKVLAKKTDGIAFFKVESDGFDLGDQRRPIDQNDLPRVEAEVTEYLCRLRSGESLDDIQTETGFIVKREKIFEDGDYNLNGEWYLESRTMSGNYPMVKIKDVASVQSGFGFPLKYQGKSDQEIPFLKVSDMNLPGNEVRIVSSSNTVSRDIVRELRAKVLPIGTVIFPKIGAAIATNKKRILTRDSSYDNNVMGITPVTKRVLPDFLYYLLSAFNLSNWASDAQPPSMRKAVVEQQQIPLPPVDAQREIVAEIERYQKVIDGARAVVENYRPHIPIDLEWPMVALQDTASVESGFRFPIDYQGHPDREIPFLKVSDMNLRGNEMEIVSWNNAVSLSVLRDLKAKAFPKGTIIFPKIGAAIATNKKRILSRKSTFDNNIMGIIPDISRLMPEFIYVYLVAFDISEWASNAQPPSMRKTVVQKHRIPVPSLGIQQTIVAALKAEQALVDANRELIARFERKIQEAIARVWGPPA